MQEIINAVRDALSNIIMLAPIVLISITIHEWAHAHSENRG
ncbi:MAG: hypothetical protein RR436_00115 [Clostridia bacterium]